MKKFIQVSIVIVLTLALALGMYQVAFGHSGVLVQLGAGWNTKPPTEDLGAGWNTLPIQPVGWCGYCGPDAGWNT